jgi:hypothetical protein
VRNIKKLSQDEYNKQMFNNLVNEIKRQCCPNCLHWIKNTETCMKYNQRPPAKVIVKGCESFEEDEIPF